MTGLPPRTHTPDRKTINDEGCTVTTFKLARACNGCGQHLGDLDNRDITDHGGLTDARAECEHCRPLVEAEAAGRRTWRITERSISRVDDEVDRLGIFAKGYWQEVDGKLRVVGLRVGTGETRVVARLGDWLVMDLDGRFHVHAAPAVVSAEAQR